MYLSFYVPISIEARWWTSSLCNIPSRNVANDCVSITKSLKLVATYTFRSTISTVNFENLLDTNDS